MAKTTKTEDQDPKTTVEVKDQPATVQGKPKEVPPLDGSVRPPQTGTASIKEDQASTQSQDDTDLPDLGGSVQPPQTGNARSSAKSKSYGILGYKLSAKDAAELVQADATVGSADDEVTVGQQVESGITIDELTNLANVIKVTIGRSINTTEEPRLYLF